MKYLIVLLFSSCSALSTVTDVFEGTYQMGKYEGRQEVLEALEDNKKQLHTLKKSLGHALVEVSLEDEVEISQLLPQLLLVGQLLSKRKNLKEELAILSASVK